MRCLHGLQRFQFPSQGIHVLVGGRFNLHDPLNFYLLGDLDFNHLRGAATGDRDADRQYKDSQDSQDSDGQVQVPGNYGAASLVFGMAMLRVTLPNQRPGMRADVEARRPLQVH